MANWLPALDGVMAKLEGGGTVADVGCGYGWSTVLMAQAFPKAQFVGYDFHPGSIEQARKHAEEHGVAARTRFEVATAKEFPGSGFDLVTCFDCLHDMGDPTGCAAHVRQALKPDGTWMVVEPMANDRLEENLNPVGRLFYGASTMICVPTSLAQEVGTALGAQAGEARLREVITGGGFGKRAPRDGDAVQHGAGGAPLASRSVSSSSSVGHGRRRAIGVACSGPRATLLTSASTGSPGARPSASAEAAVIRARSRSPATSRPTSIAPSATAPKRAHRRAQLVADADPRKRHAAQRQHHVRASIRRRTAGAYRQVERRHLISPAGWPSTVSPSCSRCATTRTVSSAATLDLLGGAAEIDPRHHLAHGTGRHDPAGRQQHHVGREPGHLVERVADEQDRDPGLLAQPVEVGQDLAPCGPGRARPAARRAGAGAGRGEQGAADRDPLPLAAGQRAGPAVEQRGRCPSRSTTSAQRRLSGRGGRRTSGRRAGCGARSDAGTGARPGTHSRCAGGGAGRRCRGRCRAAARRRARCGRGPAGAGRRSR